MATAIDLTSYGYAMVERYCDVVALVIVAYEHFLQFGAEVDLFWRKRWSFGGCLFLWSRYFSLVFQIVNVWGFVNEHSAEVRDRFFLWQNVGSNVQTVTTHLILVLRIYAMYGRTRIMLAVCCCLVIGEAVSMGVILGLPVPGLIAGNNPAPGVYICADGDPPDRPWIAYSWTIVLIGESILVCLSLYKGWQNRRSGYGSSILRILTRESVLYFIAILWIYVLNQVLWLINIVTLDELGTGLAKSISAVLANKLMISVRSHYYGNEHNTLDPSTQGMTTGMQFRTRSARVPHTTDLSTTALETFRFDDPEIEEPLFREENDEYEMKDFSEKTGF